MKSISFDITQLPGPADKPSILLSGDEAVAASLKPRLSIMIPTYRRANLLRQTLESVLSQPKIEQAEIIVMDNHPEEDETSLMMQAEFHADNLRYYKNSSDLREYSWNRGVFFAKAPWCIMLHDDDLMLPERLPLFLRIIEQFPKASLISFPAVDFKGEERFDKTIPLPRRITLRPLSLYEELQRNYISMCCTLFRRDHWLESGGTAAFIEHRPSGDYHLWLHLTEKYHETWLCNANVGAYRWSDNDSLNPETIRNVVRRNIEIQVARMPGLSRLQFLNLVSLSYEYLRKRLRQIGMNTHELDEFYQESGFPKLSLWERLYVFAAKTATRLRQELLPAKETQILTDE